MGSVVVIGSANLDTMVRVQRHPQPGETVLGSTQGVGVGGKGLNQAVAACRSGATTRFVGALGEDEAADLVRAALRECGADAVVATSRESTGQAYVMLTRAGENAIVVAAGANGDQDAIDDAVDRCAPDLRNGDVVLLQLEIPVPSVVRSLRAARAAGSRTVLNAAPSAPLDPVVLGLVDVLVVNEHECAALAPGHGEVRSAAVALAETVSTVIVTLGAEGCLVADGGTVDTLPAFAVDAVDTTAAGDTFCGALCAELASGRALPDALDFAMAAAAVTVQRYGAAGSIPRRDETEALLAADPRGTQNGPIR